MTLNEKIERYAELSNLLDEITAPLHAKLNPLQS